jgi:hypothetical protein
MSVRELVACGETITLRHSMGVNSTSKAFAVICCQKVNLMMAMDILCQYRMYCVDQMA